MRARKDKGPLRNFNFLKEADKNLLRLADDSGRDMVVILEDFLLNRRQFSPAIEYFIVTEAKTLGLPRQQIIETALLDFIQHRQLEGLAANGSRRPRRRTSSGN
jgi:hypothetical protein